MQTVLTWGIGADSTAELLMILADPGAFALRPDLSDLVVIHAVTGDEWPDSIEYANRHVLPLLRARRVRLVQVARAGHLESDGLVVLADSTNPQFVHARGPWWLSRHLREAGTVPTVAQGLHTCSKKAKQFVLDLWCKREFKGAPYRRIIGYDATETKRAAKDTRIEAAKPRTSGRSEVLPYYPLIERGMTRPAVEAYVAETFKEPISKSFCTMCCFAGVCAARPAHEARLRKFPDLAVDALMLERAAMALNEKTPLFGKVSLFNRLREDSANAGLLEHFAGSLQEVPHAVYEVRRVYQAARTDACRAVHEDRCSSPRWWCRHAPSDSCIRAGHLDQRTGQPLCPGTPSCRMPATKGSPWRSVRSVFQGSKAACETKVRKLSRLHTAGLAVGKTSRLERAHLRHDDAMTFPRADAFLVAAPVGAVDKQRPGFERVWARFDDTNSLFGAGDL